MANEGFPWIKLYTETLDDTKIGRLPDALKWRFVSLVLLAGECDADGYLMNGDMPLSDDDIAWRLRTDHQALPGELDQLAAAGLIENTDGGWLVTNFSKRQGRPYSEKRERWRERKRKQGGDQDEPAQEDSRENHAGTQEESRENHAGFTPLDKIKSREDESREESISAGAEPSSDPPKSDINKNKKPADLIWEGLISVCGYMPADRDWNKIPPTVKGQANKYAKELRQIGADPACFDAFLIWWYGHTWKGKKQERPTPADVVKEWPKFINGGGKRPPPRTMSKQDASALAEEARRLGIGGFT